MKKSHSFIVVLSIALATIQEAVIASIDWNEENNPNNSIIVQQEKDRQMHEANFQRRAAANATKPVDTATVSPTQTPEEQEAADRLYAMDYGDDALEFLRETRAKKAAEKQSAAADFATAASEVVDSQANNAFDPKAQVASVPDAPKASASKGSTQKGTDGAFQKAPSDAMSKGTVTQSQDPAKNRGQAADKTKQQSDQATGSREQSASDSSKKKGFFSNLFGKE